MVETFPPFKKTDTSYFHSFKKVTETLVMKNPPLSAGGRTSLAVYYTADANSSEYVSKCIDRNQHPGIVEAVRPIVSLIGVRRALFTKESAHLYYIMDYANSGSLDKYMLVEDKVILPEKTVIAFIQQVARQLGRFEAEGVYHGELTPGNVLVHMGSSLGEPEFRICGFGHYLRKDRTFYEDPNNNAYLDPRTILDPEKQLNISADIWSLGILAYQLATGSLPFLAKRSLEDTAEEFLNFQPSLRISPEMNHFLSRCLARSPVERITLKDIPFQPLFVPVRESLDPYVVHWDRRLGFGAFAEVFLCTRKDSPSSRYAIKILNPLENLPDDRQKMLLLGEIAILAKLRSCPYAIRLVDYFKHRTKAESGTGYEERVNLVLEMCDGADLEAYWRGQPLTESELPNELRFVAHSLASALRALHSMSIIHRDIKLKNLLVQLDPNTRRMGGVKLADFGASKQAAAAESWVGTANYIAPEVFDRIYTSKIDVWSYGVTLFTSVYGKLPQREEAPGDAVKNSARIVYPAKALIPVPEDLIDLIKRCLVPEPEKRLSMDQVLSHSYFSSLPIAVLPTVPSTYDVCSQPIFKSPGYSINRVTYAPGQGKEPVQLTAKIFSEPLIVPSRPELDRACIELIKLRACQDIFKLHHCFQVSNKLYLILDNTFGETLEDRVRNHYDNVGLPEATFRSFGRSLVGAVSYLHSLGRFHGNVSTRSVLICYDGGDMHAKLAGIYDSVQELWPSKAGEELKSDVIIPALSRMSIVSTVNSMVHTSEETAGKDVRDLGEVLYFMAFGTKEGWPTKFPEGHEQVVRLLGKCLAKGTKASEIADDPLFADM